MSRIRKEFAEEFILVLGLMMVTIGSMLVVQALAPSAFDRLTGRATEIGIPTRVNIIPSPPVICDTTFEPGWNLISLFCVRNNENVAIALAPINGSYTAMFKYAPLDTDHWKAYNPSLPNWTINDLELMYRTEGYWLYTPNQTGFYFNGTKRTVNTMTFQPGWNLVGCPTNDTKLINATLAGGGLDFSEVRAYNASIPAFRYYPSSLTYFTPYWGYWVYSNNATLVTVIW